MDILELIQSANQVLDEERRYPTVGYVPTPKVLEPTGNSAVDASAELIEGIRIGSAQAELKRNRAEDPRLILESTTRFHFASKNYNLLIALLSRVRDDERPQFVQNLSRRLGYFPGALKGKAFGPLFTSEFPLIAEFLIRNDGKELLWESIREYKVSPGTIALLQGLEDVVALNHPILQEIDLRNFSSSLKELITATAAANRRSRQPGYSAEFAAWSRYDFNMPPVFALAIRYANTLIELCRKAQFLRLADSLTENFSLEINQDKFVVRGFLERFGFSKPLIDALNEAEKLNSSSATEQELKSSLGHLRSFLEHLHSEAIPEIQKRKKIQPPAQQKWGVELAYLRVNDFLSQQEEHLVAGLHEVISDEAVHPLIAKREYARLARNVVIEYALLFLRKLDQLKNLNP